MGSIAAVTLVVLTSPFAVHAQKRLGGEFQVNTYTTSDQLIPAIAMDADGNFVVVWASGGQDGSSRGIFGQRFTRRGIRLGGEFPVNAYTTDTQSFPAVTRDAAGSFVIVWISDGQDGSGYGVYGQRFLPNASPVGGEFKANSYTTGNQFFPSVAMNADGDFVVLWTGPGQGDSLGIFGQRFDSVSSAGLEFRVNSYTTSSQLHPSVAMDADGEFVVVWFSNGQDGDSFGISGQRFTSGGINAGEEFTVNTYTTSYQGNNPSVAMDADGNFVVVWAGVGQGDDYGVFGQRFASSGDKLGGEFQVNTYTTFSQGMPSVAMNASGNFIVVWHSNGQDGSGDGVFGQRFTASGDRLGGEFRVNTYTTSPQNQASVAMDDAGNFVVVWVSLGQDGQYEGVFGQRFRFGELDFFIGDNGKDAEVSPLSPQIEKALSIGGAGEHPSQARRR